MTETVLDGIIRLLERAGRGSPDQTAPGVILWPDPAGEFVGLVGRLSGIVSVVALGEYQPSASVGPAIWVRCAIEGAAPSSDASAEGPPVVYLPGYSRDQIRDIAGGPPELQAIADLQFRGVVWLHRNGKEWTARSLLGSAGPDLEIAKDGASREALLRALPRLLDEPLDGLRRRGELDAAFFNELLAPDDERLLLLWLNDPPGTEAGTDETQWAAFLDTCRAKYGFDPDDDGPITGAQKLGERQGPWARVWARFVDLPDRYPEVPARLRAAQPEGMVPEPKDSWPFVNDQAEDNLRQGLSGFGKLNSAEAAAKIRDLDSIHGERRAWVWGRLGEAPLARALEHLVALAGGSSTPLDGTSAEEIAGAYVIEGWKVDRAAMAALAAVEPGPDGDAVGVAVRALYERWLEDGANKLQAAFEKAVPSPSEEDYGPGTCVMFVDGLRFDIAASVADHLGAAAASDLGWRFSAVPTVTPTAKPAVSPVARLLHAGPKFSPSATEGGVALAIDGLRKVLESDGWQVLADAGWGDPSGRGWIEGGDIDTQGHNLPHKLAHRIDSEARQIAEQIKELLAWGWKRVVVVTDHGWLHLPGGLPKVELPINTAELRKGRCARIPEGAVVEHLTLPWRWDATVRIAVAPGIACYSAGKVYEHGGISPQECVTPHLVVEAKASTASAPAASIGGVRWTGMRCRVEAEAPDGAVVDIRTKPADVDTSVLAAAKAVVDGKVALVVPDDQLEGTAAVIVVVDSSGLVLAQRLTTVAGESD
jgi:hypothetical protein